jgi:rhamnosyl/mannosyltransferase
MKIVFVTIDYPPLSGGLTAHVKGIVDLAQQLGHQTLVITVEPNPTGKIDGNLDADVIQLPVFKWFRDSPIINPFKMYRLLSITDSDIIHVIYPFPIGLDITCVYGFLNHKKLVCTYIDDIIVKFPYSLVIWIYEHTFWKFCKGMINSISVSTLEYGHNAVGLRDWKKGFYVIPPPIFDTEFDLNLEKKNRAREKLGLNDYDKIVLFVGSLRKRTTYKRLDLLLKAWSEYIKQNEGKKAILLIIGDGELKSYYKTMANKLGLHEKEIIFKDFVPKELLIDNYLASDIFVLPSEDNNEAFGIVTIEAMLYGNIVIATDIPGIRGAVRKSEGCYLSLIPPKRWEPIMQELEFWMDKDLREYILANHRHVKKYYTNNIVIDQLVRMYSD